MMRSLGLVEVKTFMADSSAASMEQFKSGPMQLPLAPSVISQLSFSQGAQLGTQQKGPIRKCLPSLSTMTREDKRLRYNQLQRDARNGGM